MQVNHNWYALVTVQLVARCQRGLGGGVGLCPQGENDEEEEEEDKSRMRLPMHSSKKIFLLRCFS